MRKHVAIGALMLLPLLGMDAAAQVAGQQGRRGVQRAPDAPLARRQMEQRVRQGLWRATKQRIGLSDEQMTQLEKVSQRYDQRRRSLGQQERAQRVTLRSAVLVSTADPATVSAALDQLILLQRQRVDLQAEEQKEFATFMTPVQRAKFMALQEQV